MEVLLRRQRFVCSLLSCGSQHCLSSGEGAIWGEANDIRSGLEAITTSSPHNFELLKRLGADHVFDYVRSPCPPEGGERY